MRRMFVLSVLLIGLFITSPVLSAEKTAFKLSSLLGAKISDFRIQVKGFASCIDFKPISFVPPMINLRTKISDRWFNPISGGIFVDDSGRRVGDDRFVSSIIKSTHCQIDQMISIRAFSFDNQIFQINVVFNRCRDGCDFTEKRYDRVLFDKISTTYTRWNDIDKPKGVSDEYYNFYQNTWDDDYLKNRYFDASGKCLTDTHNSPIRSKDSKRCITSISITNGILRLVSMWENYENGFLSDKILSHLTVGTYYHLRKVDEVARKKFAEEVSRYVTAKQNIIRAKNKKDNNKKKRTFKILQSID